MANHVLRQEREDLRRKAEDYTCLDEHGHVVDFDDMASVLADIERVSLARAKSAITYVARRRRSPDYEPPGPGRPAVMDAGEPVTVYLSGAQIARATALGDGNVSAGVRYAIDACLF